MKPSKILVGGFLALLATSSLASAQSVVKTWVSSTGSDTGTCDISAPCGSLQYAFNQTAVGGEVEVKDSGNYGPLYINHGVSIISTSSATLSDYGNGSAGIYIGAGTSDIITIRGLTIEGHNLSGTNGILAYSAKSVTIDHCIISGATIGIQVSTPSYVMITNNIITGNNYGITPGNSSYVILGGNIIAGNAIGLFNGTIYTYGDNYVNTNTTNDTASITTKNTVAKY